MTLLRAKRPGVSRRAIHWLLPVALLVFVPKCVLCVLAYIGAGAAFGLGGVEWCRANTDGSIPWAGLLGLLGVGVFFISGAIGFIAKYRREHRATDSSEKIETP